MTEDVIISLEPFHSIKTLIWTWVLTRVKMFQKHFHTRGAALRTIWTGSGHVCSFSFCFQATTLLQQLISLWYNCSICSPWILLLTLSRAAGEPVEHLLDSLGTCGPNLAHKLLHMHVKGDLYNTGFYSSCHRSPLTTAKWNTFNITGSE